MFLKIDFKIRLKFFKKKFSKFPFDSLNDQRDQMEVFLDPFDSLNDQRDQMEVFLDHFKSKKD